MHNLFLSSQISFSFPLKIHNPRTKSIPSKSRTRSEDLCFIHPPLPYGINQPTTSLVISVSRSVLITTVAPATRCWCTPWACTRRLRSQTSSGRGSTIRSTPSSATSPACRRRRADTARSRRRCAICTRRRRVQASRRRSRNIRTRCRSIICI